MSNYKFTRLTRSLTVIAIVGATAITAVATDFYMSDGSVISGYISNQPVTKNAKVTIQSDVAYLIIPKDTISGTPSSKWVDADDLDAKWQNWASDNDGYVYNEKGDKGLWIGDVNIKGSNHLGKVNVLQKGEVYKVVALNEDFVVPVNNIIRKVETTRKPLELTGLNYTYRLKNGAEIKGQLLETIPGKTYSVVNENGMIEAFPVAQVEAWTIVKSNEMQDIIEQVPQLDVIKLKNDNKLTGIIIGDNRAKGTLTFLNKSRGTPEMVTKADIKAYERVNNDEYRMVTDVVVEKDQYKINGRDVTPNLTCNEYNETFILYKDGQPLSKSSVNIDPDFIHIASDDATLDIYVEDGTLSSDNIMLVPVKKLPIAKGMPLFDKNAKSQASVWTYNYRDLFNNSIEPRRREVSKRGIVHFTFRMPSNGHYILYNKGNSKIIGINVE